MEPLSCQIKMIFALVWMNIDWFHPYESTQYSVGIVYLSVLNLPCDIRNKIANIIVCSVIPGPHEPNNMNSILNSKNKPSTSSWYQLMLRQFLPNCCCFEAASTMELHDQTKWHLLCGNTNQKGEGMDGTCVTRKQPLVQHHSSHF